MADTENQAPASASAEEEQPRPENDAAEPRREEAGAGGEAEKKPRPEYEIIPSKRDELESSYVAEHLHPVDLAPGVGGQNPAGQSQGPQAQGQQARLSEAAIERIQKSASSRTRVYAATGVGLGLLVGLVVAAIFLHPASPNGTSDMGNVTSDEYGLKGHLTTDWKNRLAFHLTVEPSAPEQRAGFLANINSSQRPLSIGIQVKDPFGAVLCGDTILVKFDPRSAHVETANDPKPRNEKAARELAARNEIAQGLNLARLEGVELDREHGKDVFQNDVGKDGQVASIIAQGMLPCTKKQYDNIASWSLTSDFPIVVKPVGDQSSALDASTEQPTDQESAGKRADAEKAASEKAKRKPAPAAPRISVEGDDAIVWVDATNGVIETSAGKSLILDKTDPIANTLKGRDFPIEIHYKCDQTGACTFAAIGLGAHRARLRQ